MVERQFAAGVNKAREIGTKTTNKLPSRWLNSIAAKDMQLSVPTSHDVDIFSRNCERGR